jgi:hypothetical protein
MTTRIGRIRSRLRHFGWSASERKLTTLGHGKLWLISVRRNHQVFSAQGRTSSEAWESAWDLACQIQRNLMKPPRVLPFSRGSAALSRAG